MTQQREIPLGSRVIATNSAGAEWGGWYRGLTRSGVAIVECTYIDIGLGKRDLGRHEIKLFEMHQITEDEA